MKYKVGDKVKIFNENQGKLHFVEQMNKYLGKIMTITKVGPGWYDMKEDNGFWFWYDNMIEWKVDMNKDMLKTGDVVVTRNDEEYLVLKGDFNTMFYGKQDLMFVENKMFFEGGAYNHDLTHKNDERYDVVEVERGDMAGVETIIKSAKTVWKREEEMNKENLNKREQEDG